MPRRPAWLQSRERLRDPVRVADHQQAAHAVGVMVALALELLLADGRDRNVLLAEDAVDRRPVAVLDRGVVVILLGLLLGRPAGDDADRIDVELLALRRGLVLGRLHLGGGGVHRGAVGLGEEGVAVADGEGAAGRRGAGVHDQRARAAVGLGLGAHVLQLDELAVVFEILLRPPRHLHRVEPFLGVVVALLVVALRHAEHLELVLVPADHDVQSEAAFADMVGGDELLGRDQRMKQRRVHGAERDQPLGVGEKARSPR